MIVWHEFDLAMRHVPPDEPDTHRMRVRVEVEGGRDPRGMVLDRLRIRDACDEVRRSLDGGEINAATRGEPATLENLARVLVERFGVLLGPPSSSAAWRIARLTVADAEGWGVEWRRA